MPKNGLKIISEALESGPALNKGIRVRVVCGIQVNQGDSIAQNQETLFTFGDRDLVAGFGHGLEGMRVEGPRKFKPSPYPCTRDPELEKIPRNATLIFEVKEVEILGA
jgi:FKBP-type peptidyl-prolyl cis-trans isomerase